MAIRYFCTCKERCSEKGELLCVVDKSTEKSQYCKYCRFEKCRSFAGMNDKLVSSAYQSTMDKVALTPKKTPIINIRRSKYHKTFQHVQEMITNLKKKFVQKYIDDIEVFILLILYQFNRKMLP